MFKVDRGCLKNCTFVINRNRIFIESTFKFEDEDTSTSSKTPSTGDNPILQFLKTWHYEQGYLLIL